ncbi:MAG: tRNA (adenine-N1)-methyltransferase [Candidatus Omnitrophota bacterium]|jgi:tRNA (adenine57-N1/adenine58-N1)-methyltransferase
MIQDKDIVLLWFEDDVTYLVEAAPGKKFGIHCGKPLDVGAWIGRDFGEKIVCDHGEAFLLKPTIHDLMMKASRESGIIYPKDAGLLILKAGIGPGSKVLEIGTGSGSLTMALAHVVRPSGRVHTYDRRTDLPENAHKNLKRSRLTDYVIFHQRVAGEPLDEKDFDAVILDIPTPWEEVEVVKAALKGGGSLVSLNPTFNQIEKMAEALRRSGFIRVESLELLERPILAREGKTRPVQRMVSHTEFLVFATKTNPVIEPPSGPDPLPAAEEKAG